MHLRNNQGKVKFLTQGDNNSGSSFNWRKLQKLGRSMFN